jgi:hypothetical protein
MTAVTPEANTLFFETFVRAYVGNRRFVRRDWLAQELDAKLQQQGKRFILLVAEPGAGKSTFMAQLAHDRPEWLRYFIRRDQRSVLADVSDKSLLLRIGYQLAARHPELFTPEGLRLSISQKIGEVAYQGEAVGAEVKRLIASPFYQSVLEIEQQVRKAHGRVVGLRVEDLIIEPRLLSTEDLLHLALLLPAAGVERTDPEQKIVILIDALDEIRYQQTSNNILSWLTNCPELPDNVRFVLTSRPSDEQLKLFCSKQASSLSYLHIAESDAHVKQDIEQFVTSLLSEPSVAQALEQTEGGAATFGKKATEKAHGNLGYLDALARGVDQVISQKDPRTLEALLRLKELPSDLEGLYEFFLHQVKESVVRDRVELKDPETGEAYDKPVWPAVYDRVLGVLAVAAEPINLELLERLGEIRVGRVWILHALDRLGQFLEVANNRYRLYHTTVAEFLTAQKTKDDAQRADLYQNAQQRHSQIARPYWSHREDWAKCDAYGLNNLAIHLSESDLPERALKLLDEDWMRTRYQAGGYTFEGFASDVEAIRARLTARHILTLKDHTRLALMHHVASELATNFKDEDLATLVFLGREREALAHVRLRRAQIGRCRGLLKIYQAASQTNRKNVALLNEALPLARSVQDSRERASVLLEIGEAQAALADADMESVMREAWSAIQKIDAPQERWDVLLNAIRCTIRIGLLDRAEALVAKLRADVVAISEDLRGRSLGGLNVLADATTALVRALADLEQYDRAADLIDTLKPDNERAVVSCLAFLSIAKAKRGDGDALNHAEEAYRRALAYTYGKEFTLGDSAAALRISRSLKANDVMDCAIVEARSHPEIPDRARAISRLARAYHAADPNQARKAFQEAIRLARDKESDWALETIALDLATVGECQSAVDVAALLVAPDVRSKSFIQLSGIFSSENKYASKALDAALAAFEEVQGGEKRLEVGHSLALALAKAKHRRGAELFDVVLDLMRSVTPYEFNWALAEWVPVFACAGRIEHARHIAGLLQKGSIARSQALERAIKVLAYPATIESVKTLAEELESSPVSAHILTSLAHGIAAIKHRDASEWFDRAAKMARTLEKSCARADALSQLALLLYKFKDKRTAQFFDEAYQAALGQKDRAPMSFQERLTDAALCFALAGRQSEAIGIMYSISNAVPNGSSLRKLAAGLASEGKFCEALRYANMLRKNTENPFSVHEASWALFDISLCLAASKRNERAELVAERITSLAPKIRAFCSLALRLMSHDRQRARVLFSKAISFARDMQEHDPRDRKGKVFVYLTLDLYRGESEAAQSVLEETVAEIGTQLPDADELLHALALGLCEIGQADEALRATREISDQQLRDDSLAHVGGSLARAGRVEEAERELLSVSSLGARDWGFSVVARYHAERDNFQEAERIGSLIQSSDIAALFFADLVSIAVTKGSQKVSELIDKLRDIIRAVDTKKTVAEVASAIASAGRLREALEIVSKCELDICMGLLGEWSGLFELAEPRSATVILEDAANIAGWARPDWRAVSVMLSTAQSVDRASDGIRVT